MKLKLKPTQRGFAIAEFKDRYGVDCSIQESSLATERAIWLGVDKGTHVDGQCLARMHLTRKHVQQLLPLLKRFAKTGRLEKEK